MLGYGKVYPRVTRPTASPPSLPAFVHGPVAMMVANLFLASVPILVRYAGRWDIPSSEIAFIRFAMGTAAVAAVVGLGFSRLELHQRRGLLARGILGGLSATFYFYAVQSTSAGKGALLNCTYSLWANVFAVFILRESPPKGFWTLLAVACAGLWLVLDPDFQTVNWGDALGLASGITGGAAVFSLKQLRRNTNSLSIFASFAFFGLFFSLVPLLSFKASGGTGGFWVMPPAAALPALIGVGVAGMAGQMFFTYGYGYTSIALGTLMALSVPALAALGGRVFLGEPLTPHFVLGGALILTACGILQYRESTRRHVLVSLPSVAPVPEEEPGGAVAGRATSGGIAVEAVAGADGGESVRQAAP